MRGALVLPSSAVLEGISGPYAYVVKDDLTVEARDVAVQQLGQGRLMIEKGLAEGETVVIDGQINLAPGASVTLRNPQAGAEAARPAP